MNKGSFMFSSKILAPMKSAKPTIFSAIVMASLFYYNAIQPVWAVGVDPWQRVQGSFVNWENAHVHPLDMTPDGNKLLAVNTPDNSLMVFTVGDDNLQQIATIPVGIDPISVRARNNDEAWVINHISDTVSVVDLNSLRVIATLQTEDEPADVVFAGSPEKAFVTASQVNRVNVFSTANLSIAPQSIFINGEDPRALAVSNDGLRVYVAIFESGNGTTAVTGGKSNSHEVDLVRHPEGPYGGIGIPPNDGDNYSPAINPNAPLPRAVSMIVRKDDDGRWMDDNNRDWSIFINGRLAGLGGTDGTSTRAGGRVPGWDLPDRDVAVIDVDSLDVSYQSRLMNTLMAIAVNPANDEVTVVGTDATNEIRWEPNLKGTFTRVNLARFTPGRASTIQDLNPHLDYRLRSIPQAQRNLSIGDPRGIVWAPQGNRAYITGMGSNNVIVIDNEGNRINNIEVGEGPTGIVLNQSGDRAFVLNKFDGSISVVDINGQSEIRRIDYFDPTPAAIKDGRPLLYDTHATSGLGQISCASCHVDGRTDRLAWDLGDPRGVGRVISTFSDSDESSGTQRTHPSLKGPLLTMTLQDIIGSTNMHWSGDRADLGHFADAFVDLQGADAPATIAETKRFETFIDSIHIPPNPNRNFDNSFSNNVQIPGPNGTIARTGDANVGAQQFERGCRSCHRGHSTRGNVSLGSNGFGLDVIKIAPTWRNFHERYGLWFQDAKGSNSGFGFQQDGTFDSTHNATRSNDLMAFMLSVNGRFPYTPAGLSEGNQSKDTHAAVGAQLMLDSSPSSSESRRLNTFLTLADRGEVGLIANGFINGETRSYAYVGGGRFQSDKSTEQVGFSALNNFDAGTQSIIYTLVPAGSETRIGIDRDSDGHLNGDELANASNPADASSIPGAAICATPSNIAASGAATQSSDYNSGTLAINAIDGNPDTFTHTRTRQSNATWTLALDEEHWIESITLHNRVGCCGSRFRDLTVYVLDTSGEQAVFKSHFLNRHNRENAPKTLTVDLVDINGSPVKGQFVRVVRTPDPLLIGSNGSGNADEADVLALAEVEVFGCEIAQAPTPPPTPTRTNVALLGVATQSSDWGGNRFPASFANDGDTTNFTHTRTGEPNASLQIALDKTYLIDEIVLHNRDNCCGSRLRDITVSIVDEAGSVIFETELLNPENVLGSPETMTIPVPFGTNGRTVRIRRTPDADLSGSNGGGNADESTVLSLGEVEVFAQDTQGTVTPPTPIPRNLALSGVATQSSNWGANQFPASFANDGDTTNFSHTNRGDLAPRFEITLDNTYTLNEVILRNRDNCCASRLRDITVSILDASGNVVFETELLNPENVLGSPESIAITLPTGISGHTVRVRRTPDMDLSGTNGQGNDDEGMVLSLGEVEIWGF